VSRTPSTSCRRPGSNARNAREQRFSVEFGGQVISEMQLDLFCEDVDLPKALEIFQRLGRTGRADAGWLYVSHVETAIAIGDPGTGG